MNFLSYHCLLQSFQHKPLEVQSLLLYKRFEVIETLQNKSNRLVLGVFDYETSQYLAVKFHLHVWENFGKRGPDTLLMESTVIKRLQGILGVAKFVAENLKPSFEPLLGTTIWLALQWYRDYKKWNVKPPSGRKGLLLWCDLAYTCLEFVKNSVIHRDLKPKNIIICENDQSYNFKIVDFGVALLEENPTIAWDIFLREDLYNLGKLLYFILTGNRVYRLRLDDIIAKDFLIGLNYAQEFVSICQTFISPSKDTSQLTIRNLIDRVKEISMSI